MEVIFKADRICNGSDFMPEELLRGDRLGMFMPSVIP